jgi:hypothetical protein
MKVQVWFVRFVLTLLIYAIVYLFQTGYASSVQRCRSIQLTMIAPGHGGLAEAACRGADISWDAEDHRAKQGVCMSMREKKRRSRIGICITDLGDNGINLIGVEEARLRQIVGDHLEYFQAMLGDDCQPAIIVDLIQARVRQAWLN